MFVGFSISKIESARHVSLDEIAKYRNVTLNYDINLRNPSVARTPAGEVLRADFSIAINFLNPTVGFIRFEGFCDHAGGDLEKIRKEWEAGRPDPVVQNELSNVMVGRIVPLAMLISQSLGLPPVLQLPVFNFVKPGEARPPEDKFDHTYV